MVNIVQPNGAGFVGIGDDDYVYVWCVSEFEGLLKALEGDLRVWDIIGETQPGPESEAAQAKGVVSSDGDFLRRTHKVCDGYDVVRPVAAPVLGKDPSDHSLRGHVLEPVGV